MKRVLEMARSVHHLDFPGIVVGFGCLLTLTACGVRTDLSVPNVSQRDTNSAIGSSSPVVAQPTPSPAVYPIPESPSGAAGSPTNPIGAPVDSYTECASLEEVPASTLSVTIVNTGFAQPCYVISSSAASTITISDNATNSTTGLTIPASFTLSTSSAPVVSQVVGTGAGVPSEPGVTIVQQTPAPLVNLQNALFQSATAPDSTPVTVSSPDLPAGQYLMQVPEMAQLPAAVLTITAGSIPDAERTRAAPITKAVTVDVAGAKRLEASVGISAALEAAFQEWAGLGASCSVYVNPTSIELAYLNPTATYWATASVTPEQDCSQTDRLELFGSSSDLRAVFEEQGTGKWQMNEEEGSPFPCPAPGGRAPGYGNAALPPAVLSVWQLSYPLDCGFPVYPQPAH